MWRRAEGGCFSKGGGAGGGNGSRCGSVGRVGASTLGREVWVLVGVKGIWPLWLARDVKGDVGLGRVGRGQEGHRRVKVQVWGGGGDE